MSLTHIQHSKQPYKHIPLDSGAVDDFIVSNGNCEFRLEVHALGDGKGQRGRDLSVRLCAFGDSTAALREALDLGILDIIGDIKPVGREWASTDVLAERLTALGIPAKDAPMVPVRSGDYVRHHSDKTGEVEEWEVLRVEADGTLTLEDEEGGIAYRVRPTDVTKIEDPEPPRCLSLPIKEG